MDEKDEVVLDFPRLFRQYKDGRVERYVDAAVPAGTDPVTGVMSKDTIIDADTGVYARLYCPASRLSAGDDVKLPVVVYYHGGAFVIGSAADPFSHAYLNGLVAAAGVLAVSVDYRLVPEHPLPVAYDDACAALLWVLKHADGGEGGDPWLAKHGDFSRVFLVGCSAGGNIAHAVAARAGSYGLGSGVAIRGMILIHPYFGGEEPIGSESAAALAQAAAFWRVLCPGTAGLDDPLSNPFANGAAPQLGCQRALICVAENDELRDRGVLYCENLRAKHCVRGQVELLESSGEGHCFHVRSPECDKAEELLARTVNFIHQ